MIHIEHLNWSFGSKSKVWAVAVQVYPDLIHSPHPDLQREKCVVVASIETRIWQHHRDGPIFEHCNLPIAAFKLISLFVNLDD